MGRATCFTVCHSEHQLTFHKFPSLDYKLGKHLPNWFSLICKDEKSQYRRTLTRLRSLTIIPVRMCINYFSYHCDQIPDKRQLEEGIVYSALKYTKGYSPAWQGSYNHRYVRQLVTF